MAGRMISITYDLLQQHHKKVTDYLALIEKYNLVVTLVFLVARLNNKSCNRYMIEIKAQHERIRKIAALRVLNKNNPEMLTVTPDKVFKPEEENGILAVNNENV